MPQYRCKYVHPDGARCEAQPQTGKSLCFFHDPEQQEKRAAAQSNGGSMRGRYIDSDPEPSPLAAIHLPLDQLKTTRDTARFQEHVIFAAMRDEIDSKRAVRICYMANALFYNLKYNEERERRDAEAAARDACKKEAIERKIEAAVQQALSRLNAKAGVQPTASSPGTVEGTPKEDDVIIIDGSKPLDLTQFGGKMPKFTSSQLEMTDIVTGDIHIVTSRGTTIIPGNKNKPEQKPQYQSEAPLGTTPVSTVPQTSSALAAPVEALAQQSRNSGTTENSPPFQSLLRNS